MKTEHLLAFELKKMMGEMPLENISALTLSERCGISRKTFYYYYHNIYDLLAQVFLDERIKGVEYCKDYKSLLKKIFEYYQDNEKFIDATISSAGKDLFQEFIYNIFYQMTLKYVNELDEEKKLTQNAKKMITRFYASGYSNSTLYYLSNYKNKTLNGLLNCYSFLGSKELKNAVTNYIKNNANH